MNKSKYTSDRLITNLLCIYFIIIFFYGVIIKITFPNKILFELKTFLPEAILCIICFLCCLRKKKINYASFIALFYFILILFLNLFTSYSTPSFMMTVRDVYFPIVTAFLLSSIKMSKESYYTFFRKMIIISCVSIVLGFGLGILQYIKGYEWTSSWYTGYSFWGIDNNSSILIMTSNGRVRVLSIAGNSVKFAMYTFFQILFVLISCNDKIIDSKIYNKYKFLKYIILFMGLINIYISNNKTTLLIMLFILYIHFFRKMGQRTKMTVMLLAIFIGGLLFIEINKTSNFFLSFFDRFSKWSILSELGITYNLFLPISAMNFAGNSVTTTTVLNYWDNTYLYFAYSYGLIGVVLILNWCWKLYKKAKNKYIECNNDLFVKYLFIFSIISAMTTSIVLGRAFFNVFIIIMAFISNKEEKV